MLADAGYGTNVVAVAGGIPRVHIQIYPTNYYTPSVHRYLQLAANIYDASTNRTANVANNTNGLGFPSVFRPVFFDEQSTTGPNITNRVWITGYEEVTNYDATIVGTNVATMVPFHDLENDPASRRPVQARHMVYGVPLIIGAKKGFPNFNEFALQSDISAARKLSFHRLSASSPPV